jgi:hypothetical protein
MRFWGYVLLIMGIAFLLLFVFALFGGAHLGVFPFIIAAMLVVTGVNLIRKGHGILRAEPAATELANIPPGSRSAATPAAATVSLPLSPQVAAVIAAQSARNWKLVKYLCGGIFLLFVAMGAAFAIFGKGEGDSRLFIAIFGGIGVGGAAMIAGISWLTTRRPVLRDLREQTYLRTTGPIQVVSMQGGAMLRLADRAFLMNGRAAMAALSQIREGRVDYSPHGHVILAAWDLQGRSVYMAPGYDVGWGG